MKNLVMSLCLSLCCAPVYGAIESIFHSKVIQSTTPPPVTERPENFQRYLNIFDYLSYQYPISGGRSYYVLFGYPTTKREDATTTILDKLMEYSSEISSPS